MHQLSLLPLLQYSCVALVQDNRLRRNTTVLMLHPRHRKHWYPKPLEARRWMTRRNSKVEVEVEVKVMELDRGRHEVTAALIIRECVINENHSSWISSTLIPLQKKMFFNYLIILLYYNFGLNCLFWRNLSCFSQFRCYLLDEMFHIKFE